MRVGAGENEQAGATGQPVPELANFAALLARLAEFGPPSEIRNQSPALAASVLKLDRVVLSSIRDGVLMAEAVHLTTGRPSHVLSRLRDHPVALEYPLIEGEVMRRRRAQVVRVTGDDELGPRHAYAELLGWTEYITAPVMLDSGVVGFFHGDRDRKARPLDEADAAALGAFAACFSVVFECAVLRTRLRAQRREMRQVASWADGRATELGDRAITLDDDTDIETDPTSERHTTGVGENAVRELLTRREFEIVQMMARGDTNATIAKALVVSEGTVKFHVKNILRKLHASNRAEATSRYLRLSLNDRGGRGAP
jgi:LuxR family transcriptional regulator, regulator of acetate metabolism